MFWNKFKNKYEVEIRKEYYDSDALWREAPYVNGKMHGIEKYYEMATSNMDGIILYNKNREVLTLCCESYRSSLRPII